MVPSQHVCYLLEIVLLLQTLSVRCQECEPDCSVGHGVCINGRCFCHNPWGGEDCSSLASAASGSAISATQQSQPQTLTSEQLEEDQMPQASQLQQNAMPSELVVLPPPAPRSVIRSASLSEPIALRSTMYSPVPSERALTPPASRRVIRPAALSEPIALPSARYSPTPSELVLTPLASRRVTRSASPSEQIALPSTRLMSQRLDNPMEAFRAKPRYRVVSSVGEKESGIFSPRSLDIESSALSKRLSEHSDTTSDSDALLALATDGSTSRLKDLHSATETQFLGRGETSTGIGSKRGIINETTCYYVPIAIQGGIFVLIVIFMVLDCAANYHSGTAKVVNSSWTCGCCMCLSRCVRSMNWRTGVFLIVFLMAVNATWIYLCYTGTAVKYVEQVAFVLYVSFIFLGAITLLVMELYYRYGQERVERLRDLEGKVDRLVNLLQVKYGYALDKMKEHGKKAGDRLDDATDFIGLTEASSDDDVTCMQAARCQGPGNRGAKASAKAASKRETMSKK